MMEVVKDFKACYNKALHLLSLRAHFARELETKLRRREFLDEDVRTTIERLTEKGFLNEEETARQFAVARSRRLGEVGVRLIQELRKRGVDGDLAASVVASLEGPTAREIARAQVEKLRARGATDDRIGRRLSRKGFGKADILRALSEDE